MKRVTYIGPKPVKHDNMAGTGLVWRRGETLEVADDAKADKLVQHPTVWIDADKHGDQGIEQLLRESEPRKALSGVQYVVVAVAREDLDKLLGNQAVVRIVHAVSETGPMVGDAIPQVEKPGLPRKEEKTRWDGMKKGEIIKVLKEEFGLELDFKRYTDAEMIDFAKGVEAEQVKAAA